jgi:glycosyltransferase involved in cell wall biosynthesis
VNTKEPTAAIVIPTDQIGGAEKRLSELWVALRRRSGVAHLLVVSEPLRDHLLSMVEFRAALTEFSSQVVVHAAGAAARHRALVRLAERQLVDVWHAVMASPLSLGLVRPAVTVFTVPIATTDLLNARGKLAVQAGVAFADAVDVLDTGLTESLRRLLPWKSAAIRNTPGSQIDLEAYRPLPHHEKRNTLVFCGLLSRAKNADRLLEALPELHAKLTSAGVRDLSYVFLGRDTPELRFYDRVRAKQAELPVTARFDPNPASVLAEAKVFFSVQQLTNYPSKSLLEAVACGALPVVTDVGDSRLIAQESFAHFIRGTFTAEDLVAPCLELLTMPAARFEGRVAKGRTFIAERFSLAASVAYYQSLYSFAASRRDLAP